MDTKRYARQIAVDVFGKNGQHLLSKKHITIIGAGGLGSHSAAILVRMGIGSLTIIDNDVIDVSNLHRTSIFTEEDVQQSKIRILTKRLRKINSGTILTGIEDRITKNNFLSLIKNTDVLLDGTDSMATRYLINEISIQQKIPWVYGGVDGTVGMVLGIIPKKTPCLSCISQTLQEKRGTVPVLGNVPLQIASIQCTEALKILLHQTLAGFILYDTWKQHFEVLDIKRNTTCQICSKEHFKYL